MAEITKAEMRAMLLDQVGKWFDSATSPESNDHSLIIERSTFIRDQATRAIKGSNFTVRALLNVGAFTAPVETPSSLIQFTP